MLLRPHEQGVIAIGQASHAWISGQLARAWGNERFGSVEPWEEVCLGAEQHDVGMALWDAEPDLDPRTGLPYSFMEMPLQTHLELWSAAPLRMLSQSTYAALLVSLHGSSLYERRDLSALPPADTQAVRDYLEAQRALQEGLLATLRADPASASGASDDAIARNGRLVWTWDYLSLAICLDWSPCRVAGVPAAGVPLELELRSLADRRLTLHPWPFAREALAVRCEGRALAGRFADQDAMRAVLASAPALRLDFELLASDPR